jgi:hypothetical protein
MKTFRIELQKIKSMAFRDGQIEARVDALVTPTTPREDAADPSTVIALTEANARVLLLLIKQQLATLDDKKPRSRRSGRA